MEMSVATANCLLYGWIASRAQLPPPREITSEVKPPSTSQGDTRMRAIVRGTYAPSEARRKQRDDRATESQTHWEGGCRATISLPVPLSPGSGR